MIWVCNNKTYPDKWIVSLERNRGNTGDHLQWTLQGTVINKLTRLEKYFKWCKQNLILDCFGLLILKLGILTAFVCIAVFLHEIINTFLTYSISWKHFPTLGIVNFTITLISSVFHCPSSLSILLYLFLLIMFVFFL